MRKFQNIAVILLAAGESARMNGIKQLLPWKSTFLLQHSLDTILETHPEWVVLVLGANSDKIKSRLNIRDKAVQVIENATWQKGLGSSISKGVHHLLKGKGIQPEGILICLADQPLVTANYLNDLISEFKSGIYTIVASNFKNRVGVPAIFNNSVYPELLHLDTDYGAKNIIANHTSSMLGLDADAILADIDTPEAYEKLYNQHHDQ